MRLIYDKASLFDDANFFMHSVPFCCMFSSWLNQKMRDDAGRLFRCRLSLAVVSGVLFNFLSNNAVLIIYYLITSYC
jgi:hypothetical protein